MKRTIMIVLAIAVALSMTACSALDALLSVNVFAPFAGVSAGAIEKATPDELVEMSGSESFYETLADDPELKDAILDKIDEAIDGSTVGSAEYEELLVLAANIELQTSPAGDLINNVGGVVEVFLSGDTSSIAPESFITNILPETVYDEATGVLDETSFIAMINALEEANVYYERLGNNLGTDGLDDSISAGDVVQAAIISALVSSIEIPTAEAGNYDSTGAYLYALITDDSDSITAPEFTEPNLESGYLAALLAAAEISFE